MAQAVGVVGVLVAGHDLVEALAQQEQRVVADAGPPDADRQAVRPSPRVR